MIMKDYTWDLIIGVGVVALIFGILMCVGCYNLGYRASEADIYKELYQSQLEKMKG